MRIRALFAALALVLLGLIIPASPAGAVGPPSGNPTSCAATAQLRNLGDRTCFDKSDQRIYVYSGATTVWASYPATGAFDCQPLIATPWEWSASAYYWETVAPSGGLCGSWSWSGTREACYPNASGNGLVWLCNASAHDVLEWFAAGNTHEFVIVW